MAKAQLPHSHCFPLGRAKRVLQLGHFTRRLILEVLLGKKKKGRKKKKVLFTRGDLMHHLACTDSDGYQTHPSVP